MKQILRVVLVTVLISATSSISAMGQGHSQQEKDKKIEHSGFTEKAERGWRLLDEIGQILIPISPECLYFAALFAGCLEDHLGAPIIESHKKSLQNWYASAPVLCAPVVLFYMKEYMDDAAQRYDDSIKKSRSKILREVFPGVYASFMRTRTTTDSNTASTKSD